MFNDYSNPGLEKRLRPIRKVHRERKASKSMGDRGYTLESYVNTPDPDVEAELVATVDDWVIQGIEIGLRKGNLALRVQALLQDAIRSSSGWGIRPKCELKRLRFWLEICRRFPVR